jgi:hypothetical protein
MGPPLASTLAIELSFKLLSDVSSTLSAQIHIMEFCTFWRLREMVPTTPLVHWPHQWHLDLSLALEDTSSFGDPNSP